MPHAVDGDAVTPAPSVLVIGDALVDITVAPIAEIRPGSDVPAAIAAGPGGQGANIAVRLARRGNPVRLLCAIGADPPGELVAAWVGAEGVMVQPLPAVATGMVVVHLFPGADRAMASQREPFARAVAAMHALPPADAIVVSGYLLLEAEAGALVERLAAAETDLTVVGCALHAATAVTWWERVRRLRPSVVIVNADEARLAPPAGDAEPIAAFAQASGATVVVTDANGVTAVTADGRSSAVPVPAATGPVVDATGAGDAFAAAFIAQRCAGASLPAALEAGARSGAAVARVAGAQGRVALERAGHDAGATLR